ncbi:3-hydroxyacyl-CoA dehydrogenase [Alicyclobacillus sp.]|uniref:3-hydroxyacyl-CoA dehydrogenase n=1 Tax=Alicyclobacillus sp. TaxID=61169 RepID=UPI0025C72963|nr:3-hydroxyacyl-CoA dehydrogenase [Alicyclobacillus sp.]MCL6518088.1 3-hydroxyacyl-CoA dehydrogenase [Alicyclobacillus sp.]
MRLEGARFIITGGGSGLGEATARLFSEAGARVTIFDVQETRGRAVAEETGGLFLRVDVADGDGVRQAVDEAALHMGGLNGVVNCAGVGIARKVVGRDGPHPLDDFARVIQVNLIGTFNVIRCAAAKMMEAAPDADGERGVIINTASVAAFEGQIGQAAYSASKGGVVGMTLPIARELAASGIRVVTIAPGLFDTPLLGSLPEAARRSLGAQVPFPPRLGQPREYALLARHIVENGMLNGEVIRLDGAIRMQPR